MNNPSPFFVPVTPINPCNIELSPEETVVLWQLLDHITDQFDALPRTVITEEDHRISGVLWRLQAMLSDKINFVREVEA